MTLHIADYEIVLAPAGLVVLAACIAILVAILVLGVVAIVRIVQRRGQPMTPNAEKSKELASR